MVSEYSTGFDEKKHRFSLLFLRTSDPAKTLTRRQYGYP
jgi:hypothetical protein